ncbi:MAG: DNA gyrase subunit A [Candidatus Shikimatogenerans bostrichidophilus]|nr:MAG: DNA gyrase subunit A [Candidatus Shikimatogenerans bostrichidophilus]
MQRIKKININKEIKKSYIDYAMSVIVSRALPDVRDGLKPVHRRILYSMYKLGIKYNKQYKKSARIVGEVLGKYHPHGDKSVYDSIVRMAQKWNLRYKLIKGQGNFGSIDNDPPAAMRYTEIKLEKITEEILDDIKNNTVKMKPNFDDTLIEPVILPSKIPNLLINGISGIAVGMATNMPPHNLIETINAICEFINNKNIKIKRLIKYIKGPDFPTGGTILYYEGVKKALKTGKGKIIIRSKFLVKETSRKKYIIIKEIPYQVIKSRLIQKIYDLIKKKKIEEIINIKDESNKNGIRIILLLKKESITEEVINKLLKYSDLQISYYINNIALVNNKPKRLNIKELIYYFVEHRNKIIIKRAKYNLSLLKEKIHLLKGFIKITKNLKFLLNLINKSKSYKDSFKKIKKYYNLSDKQSKFILNIKLYKLTNQEIKKNLKNYKKIKKDIKINLIIINNKKKRMNIIKEELLYIKKKYGDKRKTLIDYSNNKYLDINLIIKNKVVLIITKKGYIKKTPLYEFKKQKRGGVGYKGIKLNDKDNVKYIIITYNNYYILLFTKYGKCYWIKINEIPQSNKMLKGRAIQNFINIDKEDKIKTYLVVKDIKDKKYINKHYVVLVTSLGIVKKTKLNKYSNIRQNGIYAIYIKKNDSLLKAILTNGKKKIFIAIKSGKAIIFDEKKIKQTSRKTIGVKGIKLKKQKDKVIGIGCINKKSNKYILGVSEKGYGKITNIKCYRVTNRGGVGVKTINITKKTGYLIYILVVKKKDEIIIIKNTGYLLRIPVKNIRKVNRNSQGVKLIKLNLNEKIVDIGLIKKK